MQCSVHCTVLCIMYYVFTVHMKVDAYNQCSITITCGIYSLWSHSQQLIKLFGMKEALSDFKSSQGEL